MLSLRAEERNHEEECLLHKYQDLSANPEDTEEARPGYAIVLLWGGKDRIAGACWHLAQLQVQGKTLLQRNNAQSDRAGHRCLPHLRAAHTAATTLAASVVRWE